MVVGHLQGIFLSHRAELGRFARARCQGNGPDADDILQDLWLKLNSVAELPAEPLSYLYRMADNLVIDRHRSTRRRERRDDAWQDVVMADPVAAPHAERAVAARSELAHVSALFDELGEPTAGIFRSYRIDGEPQRAIAIRYGLSLSAIEKHLQKAYKAVVQLRDRLDAEMDGAARHNRERRD